MLSALHHVGYLTEDYNRTIRFYRDVLGGTIVEQMSVSSAVTVAFLEWPQFRIEVVGREERGTYLDDLLDVLAASSPYHLAVTVPDINKAIANLQDDGYPMFDEKPVDGLGPYSRAFVEPDAVPGMPVELVEIDAE